MKYISNLSGGRDSTAMTIRLLELKAPLDHILFCDTGYEFPKMYEYIEKLNKYIKKAFNKEIEILNPTTSIEEWAFSPFTSGINKGKLRGLPINLGMSYCTRELKVKRIEDFLKSKKYDEVSFYVGYTHDEVKNGRGSKMPNNFFFPLHKWKWNELEVTNYLKEKSIYNDLYDDFTRTGCFCCPKQSINSWKTLLNKYPKLWDWCVELERKAKEKNCLIQTFRADGIPLKDRELSWRENYLPFDDEWNDSEVSCFCKF